MEGVWIYRLGPELLVNQIGVRKMEIQFDFHNGESGGEFDSGPESTDEPNWIWLIPKKFGKTLKCLVYAKFG